MNTIYDGSYVLGSTSALTFEAGPGIKIDSPSAGTVRIGNDETVLWEGFMNTTAQTGQFSEKPHNFRVLRTITLPDQSGQRPAQINDFDLTWNFDGNTIYAQWQTYNIGSNTYSGQTWYLSGCTNGSLDFKLLAGIKQVNGTVTTGLTTYQGNLVKVIGINRISGGNE